MLHSDPCCSVVLTTCMCNVRITFAKGFQCIYPAATPWMEHEMEQLLTYPPAQEVHQATDRWQDYHQFTTNFQGLSFHT